MKKFILETFLGANKEASAKRITAWYFVTFLITTLHAAYIYYMFKYQTLEYLTDLQYAYLIFVAVLLGLATIENITNLVKTIKGYAKSDNTNSDTINSSRNIDRGDSTQESQN